jgi:hypothetical protein
MDRNPTSVSGGRRLEPGEEVSFNAARYVIRERQKKELRRERDAIVLSIARDLGERGLADRLGVSQPSAAKLLAGARERLDASPSPAEHEIAARRLGADRDRWAEADTHFEQLGRGPTVRVRRGPCA